MLVVKVLVNDKPIDELHIQNVGPDKNGWFWYQVKKPTGIMGNKCYLHRRERGYIPLLEMVLADYKKKRRK